MRAWQLHRHGDPERGLRLVELADPRPGPGQVLIRAEGFGINYADVMAVRGLYREAPPLPSVLGYEVVGRVVACGPGASTALQGRRVVALTRFGGYAELALADVRACAPVPDDLPLGVAAALATQGCTAWYAARMAVPLRAGMRVLVHSAAGGVGQLLVQLALRSGCTVFAVVGGADKVAHVRALGVQHAIDRKTGPYEATVRTALAGERLDVSFNAVAGHSFRTDMGLIGSGGTVVLFGGAQRGSRKGPFATVRFVWDMGLVVPIFLMMRSKGIVGINMLKLGDHRPELVAECFQAVVREAVGGGLRPHVHATLPSMQLPPALQALGAGGTMGKVALSWEDQAQGTVTTSVR
ncbi:MAG TPA: zinc-binding dehydrogenase [Flavobacteriales bacterium]|nr:zinc-binding dehydrogenase [Flavobacteriales bacterium]